MKKKNSKSKPWLKSFETQCNQYQNEAKALIKQMNKEKNKSTLGLEDSGINPQKNSSYDLERSNYGDNDVRRASTIEVTSGQSFLLLKNQEFII